MQQNTAGDQYSFPLVLADGITSLPLTNIATIEVAITPPGGATAATNTPVTLTGNIASFVTTLTPQSTFPVAGSYKVQFIVTYIGGDVAKSNVFSLTIERSLV